MYDMFATEICTVIIIVIDLIKSHMSYSLKVNLCIE